MGWDGKEWEGCVFVRAWVTSSTIMPTPSNEGTGREVKERKGLDRRREGREEKGKQGKGRGWQRREATGRDGKRRKRKEREEKGSEGKRREGHARK